MRRFGRARCAALILAVLVPTAAAGQQWYRSNPAGVAVQRIPVGERDQHPWTLSVRTEEGLVERRLWSGSDLVETVVQRTAGGGRLVSEEQIVDGVVRSRLVYSPAGLIAEEERFGVDGVLIERFRYRYQGDRLVEVNASDDTGALWTDVYRYTPDGMLREVRRDYPDQPARASRFRFVAGRLVEEEHQAGDQIDRILYDRLGRVEREVQEEAGSVVVVTRFVFSGTGTVPIEAVVQDIRTGETTTRRIDPDGRTVGEERRSAAGLLVERMERDFGPHGIVRELREAPGRREARDYSYHDDGRLAREEVRVNGRLQRRVIHPDDGERIEERFHDGRLVLRLFFAGDRLVSQEVIRDGDVLRVR